MELLKNKIMEHKYLYIIIFISFLFILYYFVFGIKTYSQSYLTNETVLPSEMMKNGTTYTQYFKSNIESLSEIGIKFSTYMNNNKNGSIVFKIYDEKNDLLKEDEIDVEDILDNQIVYIDFEEIKESLDKEFKVEFYFNKYSDGITLSFWYAQPNEYNYLVVNNEKIDASINLVLTGKSNDYTVLWYPLMLILICFMIITII